MLIFDGHDNAQIGVACIWRDSGRVDVAVYSGDVMVQNLINGGLEEEEAREFIEYNVEGAYLGIETPVIVWAHEKEIK